MANTTFNGSVRSENGFETVEIEPPPLKNALEFNASATPPDDPWAKWAAAAISRTTGKKTAVIPVLVDQYVMIFSMLH